MVSFAAIAEALRAAQDADASLRVVRVTTTAPDAPDVLRLDYSAAAVEAGAVDEYQTADGRTVAIATLPGAQT